MTSSIDQSSEHRLVVHGDDLTGAAEAAAVLHRLSSQRVRLFLNVPPPLCVHNPADTILCVVDTDTRQLSGEEAERRARSATASVPPKARLVTKVDSLLRGNIVAHLRALEPHRHPVIFAPALPIARRTVIDGVPLVAGVPLSVFTSMEAGAGMSGLAPATLQAAVAPLTSAPISLDVIRSGIAQLARTVREITNEGKIALCDTAVDEDLDALVEATWDIPSVRLVGAAALVSAVSRRLPRSLRPVITRTPRIANIPHSAILIVVGTAELIARRQVEALLSQGQSCDISVPADLLRESFADPNAHVHEALDAFRHQKVVVLRVTSDATPALRAGDDSAVVKGLAKLTQQIISHAESRVDLVLTGGHTARSVLDVLAISVLEVRGEVHHGAVLLEPPDGSCIVTRPGSFGTSASFVQIVQSLQTRHNPAHPQSAANQKAS